MVCDDQQQDAATWDIDDPCIGLLDNTGSLD
jgi:hypothetical protein